MSNSVSAHNTGYRQGVVLGLTMAEVMVLLVFVLLLLAGATIQQLVEKNRLKDDEISNLKSDLAQANAVVAELKVFDGIKLDPATLRNAIEIAEILQKHSLRSSSEMAQYVELLLNRLKSENAAISPDWKKLVDLETRLANLGGIEAVENLVREFKEIEAALRDKGYSIDQDADVSAVIADNLLQQNYAGQHNWPPSITMSEANGFSFALGRAELPPDFEATLRDVVVPRLKERIAEANVNIIEIVGHTDPSPIRNWDSNLDTKLGPALRGQEPISVLVPGDNAGLGLARAIAVARVLQDFVASDLKGARILPLSGAHFTALDETLDNSAAIAPREFAARRRIEIRLRRSQGTEVIPARP